MAVVGIRLTEINRLALSKILFVVSWLCTLFGFLLFAGGLYIKLHIESKIRLIEGYNSNILLIVLLIVGGLLIFVDLIGGKLIYDVGDINRRRRIGPILLLFLLFLVLLNLMLFSTGTMCFIHQIHLRNSFHEGLLSAMSKYSENDTVKVEIDHLQIEFTCCGNDGYEDWFDIQWINSIYLNLDDQRVRNKMTNGKFLNDDVPFSCCNPYSIRPCIHHHVHDDMLHYNYDHRTGLTLHTVGCKESLMRYFSRRLQYLGAVVFLIFLIQMAILFGLRLLQTSIAEAEDLGDSEATTMGYLFNTGTSSSQKKIKDIEDIGEDDSDFLDDSTFDEEDFEEEVDNGQFATGPVYENSPLPGTQPQEHPQNQPVQATNDSEEPLDPLSQGSSEGKKKSSPGKSAKESRGLSTKETGKRSSTKDSKKKESTRKTASPKTSTKKSMMKGKKKLTGSIKKGVSKGKSLKQKGLFKGKLNKRGKGSMKQTKKLGRSSTGRSSKKKGGFSSKISRKSGNKMRWRHTSRSRSKRTPGGNRFASFRGRGGRGMSSRMRGGKHRSLLSGKAGTRRMPKSTGFKSFRGPKKGFKSLRIGKF